MLYVYVLTIIKLLVFGVYCPSAAFPSNGLTADGGDDEADRARIVGIRATIPGTSGSRRAAYDFVIDEYKGQELVRQSFASPSGIFQGNNLYKASRCKEVFELETIEGEITLDSFRAYDDYKSRFYGGSMTNEEAKASFRSANAVSLNVGDSFTDFSVVFRMGLSYDAMSFSQKLTAEITGFSDWDCQPDHDTNGSVCLWVPREEDDGVIEPYQWFADRQRHSRDYRP